MSAPDFNASRLDFAKAAFEHAYAVSAAVNAEGADWDPDYVLKETASTLRELIERTEIADKQRQYELGLRMHALSAIYLSKLLNSTES